MFNSLDACSTFLAGIRRKSLEGALQSCLWGACCRVPSLAWSQLGFWMGWTAWQGCRHGEIYTLD